MSVGALAELIENQRTTLGRSYRDIADRAKQHGFTIGKSRVRELGTEPITNVPPTETLRALSVGLELPLSVLVDAALESCGLRRSTHPTGRWVTITARKEGLTEAKQRAIEAQVDAAIRFYEGEPDTT